MKKNTSFLIPLDFLETPYGPLDFQLYEKILRKDAHIFSLMQTRKHTLLAAGFDIVPASSSSQDEKLALFVQKNIEQIPQFQDDLYSILSAFDYGFSVTEIFYKKFLDQIWIKDLRFRHPSRFRFSNELDLILINQESNPIKNCSKESPYQFIVYRCGGNDSRPYGESLLTERIFWLYYYKKNILDFLISFLERFGHPIPVFRYPENLSNADHHALEELMRNFHQDLAAKIPNCIDFSFLEWKGDKASTLMHENILRWLNHEISKAILGQTLTSETSKSGSFAQSKVHENILKLISRFDAVRLEETINAQLIQPLIILNFGMQSHYPRIRFRYEDAENSDALIERDLKLHQMGLRFPIEYFEKRYSLSSLSFHPSYYNNTNQIHDLKKNTYANTNPPHLDENQIHDLDLKQKKSKNDEKKSLKKSKVLDFDESQKNPKENLL